MPPKRKAPSAHGGVGYGGAQGDTKRLLAGRKKAEKKGTSEDAARTKYLKDCKAALDRNLSKVKETDPIDSIINERERDKVAKDLSEIFRNQPPQTGTIARICTMQRSICVERWPPTCGLASSSGRRMIPRESCIG